MPKKKTASADKAATGSAATPAASAPRRVGRISIVTVLLLLMAAIVVPGMFFSLVLLQRNNQAQQTMLSSLAEVTASSITESVDRQLTGMLTTLRVLATSHHLQYDSFADYYTRVGEALAGSDAYLIVTDANLQQLVNTRVPYGTALGPIADVETAHKVMLTGEPAVSKAFFGETAGKWVFNVVLPIPNPRGVGRLLILTHDADHLAPALARSSLRGGWNAVVTDADGVVLSSSVSPDDIGKPFFLSQASPPPPGILRQKINVGGIAYEMIQTTSNVSGWRIFVWAPSATLQAPLAHSLRLLALGGIALVAIGILLAWLLGRQIASPIRRLARDARSLGAGEKVEPVDYLVTEIATVSQALAHASADRLAAESEIRFLMREVAHRSKNQLTVVSSIAKQTARHARTLPAFQDSFLKRIHGLARSTDLLIAGGVAGIELRELVDAQLEPFRPTGSGRVEVKGDSVRMSHQAAQTLGLALHEMATNAAKYGAFSMPEGKLIVSWKASGTQLDMVWREFVPKMRRRSRTTGFGTEVIERMLGGALAAAIERVFHRNGLECRFSIPMERLAPDREPGAGQA